MRYGPELLLVLTLTGLVLSWNARVQSRGSAPLRPAIPSAEVRP